MQRRPGGTISAGCPRRTGLPLAPRGHVGSQPLQLRDAGAAWPPQAGSGSPSVPAALLQAMVLTPGRHVGAEEHEDDGEPFEERMKRLAATLRGQQAEVAKQVEAIARNLASLGLSDGGGRREPSPPY
jgi:hypothetical protein